MSRLMSFTCQMKQLDGNLRVELEEILNNSNSVEAISEFGKKNAVSASDPFEEDHKPSPSSARTQETDMVAITSAFSLNYIRFFLHSFCILLDGNLYFDNAF